jgi:hypothetical protein
LLWALAFIVPALAFTYGAGSYGAGLYNVGALDATTTTLTSSLNPSTFGSGVTLRGVVSPSSATGTLTFKDGAVTLGTATLGHASGSLTTAGLAVGGHSLTAVYGGNAAFSGSTSNTVTQTVNKGSTSVTLSPSQNPTSFGQSLTLTAFVLPSTATGTFTFKDGATTLGTATVGHGSGRYVTSALTVGTHPLTVVYGGNANYLTSTSPTVNEVVNTASSSTTILSIVPNPSTYGSGVVLTASVTPSTATGTLTFLAVLERVVPADGLEARLDEEDSLGDGIAPQLLGALLGVRGEVLRGVGVPVDEAEAPVGVDEVAAEEFQEA